MPHKVVQFKEVEQSRQLERLFDDGWIVNRVEKTVLKKQREGRLRDRYPEQILEDEVCEYLIVLEHS